MQRPDSPFPKHWLYYIALKYAVISAAILIAIYRVNDVFGASLEST
jgi:hypothetical protein